IGASGLLFGKPSAPQRLGECGDQGQAVSSFERWRAVLAAEPPQLVQDVVKALTVDELHGGVVDAPGLADAEDRHEVRMVHPGHGPRLAADPLQLALAQEASGREHLERHVPAERLLHRLVYDPHSAPPNFAEDLEVAQLARDIADVARGRTGERAAD